MSNELSVPAGRAGCRSWALNFIARHGEVQTPDQLRALLDRERGADDAFRTGMAQLPIDLVANVLVHHTSGQIAYQKVREASHLAGLPITRREYWNKLDRAAHYAAGLLHGMGRESPPS